jgi:AhpD family alkylhydroperoxidase
MDPIEPTDRIGPLPLRSWPPAMREALAAMAPPQPTHAQPPTENRPRALNTLGVLARHPALARAFLTFNGHVLMATTLSQRQRELVVLRVAALDRCRYEWAQHVIIAGDVGLDADEIRRIATGPDSPAWSGADAALLRSVDELIAGSAISDPTWRQLASHLDDQQILDLIFCVGAYHTLAWMMRSFDLELDDDLLEALPRELDLDAFPPQPTT